MTFQTPGGPSIHWATRPHRDKCHSTEFICDTRPVPPPPPQRLTLNRIPCHYLFVVMFSCLLRWIPTILPSKKVRLELSKPFFQLEVFRWVTVAVYTKLCCTFCTEFNKRQLSTITAAIFAFLKDYLLYNCCFIIQFIHAIYFNCIYIINIIFLFCK